MNFVEVTYLDGEAGFINLDNVTEMSREGDKTFVYFNYADADDDYGCAGVLEPPELILSRVERGTNDSPQV